ncbi:MAG TPA: alpha/beta hydrolase [Parvibaculum sp.]|jgi:acetyl esterase/lipase
MSIQLYLMRPLLRFQIKRRFKKNPDVFLLRPIMEEALGMQKAPPADIAFDQTTLGGVPTERISAPGSRANAAIFYIHGGGWVAGSPKNHRPLTWRLSRQLGVPVYAPDYRLAPEHPFPAGLDDCLAAWRALLDTGLPASSIVIGGDSAGGNLTLALALRLKDEGLPLPAALVCLSAATDLASTGSSFTTNAKADALFIPEMMGTVEARYFPGGDARNPYLSPLYGDVAGLPPTLFQVGATEMLLDDSTRMAEKMKAAGIAVTLEVWPKVWHVWQLMADQLPEGEKAIQNIVAFVKKYLPK